MPYSDDYSPTYGPDAEPTRAELETELCMERAEKWADDIRLALGLVRARIKAAEEWGVTGEELAEAGIYLEDLDDALTICGVER